MIYLMFFYHPIPPKGGFESGYNYKTFVEFTALDYNKGTYVSQPSLEAIKAELAKITTDEVLVNQTSVLKTSFLMAWKILFTFVIQDQKFRSLPNVLSNSNFTKDPSKVTGIELTATIIVVNNLETSMSPLLFSRKKKKMKSQTVSQPKQKTQGPKASASLPQKRKQPKPKKSTPQTQVTPPVCQRRILIKPNQSVTT
ncbi:hypothetical protein Tco_1076982 [Tanacetum coccineum]